MKRDSISANDDKIRTRVGEFDQKISEVIS